MALPGVRGLVGSIDLPIHKLAYFLHVGPQGVVLDDALGPGLGKLLDHDLERGIDRRDLFSRGIQRRGRGAGAEQQQD